jgi:hypothetical protein
MISASALSQAILVLLCYDKKNAQFLANRIDPRLFRGRVVQTIAKAAISYIKEYRLPPGEQLELLLENELRRGEEGKLMQQMLDSFPEQYAALQPEFILSELQNWETGELINQVAQDAIEAVAQGDVIAAKKALSRQRAGTKEEEPGIWLHDPVAMLRGTDNTITEFFSSGVAAIDKLNLIPQRKTISCWMAPTGKGKTWSLVNEIKAGIQFGKTTLVITMELSQEKYAGRLLQALFSLTKSEAKEVRLAFFPDGQVNYIDVVRGGLTEKRRDIQKRLSEAQSWPRVLIKEYPTGRFTVEDLNFLLDRLEQDYDFIPDQIIIDQPSNMTVDKNNLRIGLGRLWVDLRGVAVDRNAAVICAAQSNRGSDGATTVDIGDIAEDWSIMGTCDAVYTYSQTKEEFQLGLSRIFVAKYRDEADRVMVLNSQSYTIGQFSLDSVIARNLKE